jgi:hypothetical protein
VVTGTVNGDTINYTLATSASQFSNVGHYPIDVTLGANPNYSVVSTNGILSVTQKYCCNSNSRWQIKVYGMKILRCGYWYCQWRRYHQLYLATTASQFSNVGQYPIDVTLGDNPNYTVVAKNAILSVDKTASVTPIATNKTVTIQIQLCGGSKWF